MRPFRISRGLAPLAVAFVFAACDSSTLPTAPAAPAAPAFAKGNGKPGGGGGSGPTTRNPILFVHGYNSSGSTWDTMVGRFKNDGWTDQQLYAWTYDYRLSNRTTANDLKAKVAEILQTTGATKVDIITHSMGGLSSRYYAKYLQGDVHIDAWVSLGGPNHGTDWAKRCVDASCVEMRVGSDFLTNTTDGLNYGDETPGVVRHGTWRSPCDAIVPMSSVPVDGGQSTDTGCVTHTQLQNDRTIYRQVRDFVAAAT